MLLFAIVVVNVVIGVRAGEEGGGAIGTREAAAPQLKIFLKFVGLNADYSDKSTREK